LNPPQKFQVGRTLSSGRFFRTHIARKLLKPPHKFQVLDVLVRRVNVISGPHKANDVEDLNVGAVAEEGEQGVVQFKALLVLFELLLEVGNVGRLVVAAGDGAPAAALAAGDLAVTSLSNPAAWLAGDLVDSETACGGVDMRGPLGAADLLLGRVGLDLRS
jgi:hypothetical protein